MEIRGALDLGHNRLSRAERRGVWLWNLLVGRGLTETGRRERRGEANGAPKPPNSARSPAPVASDLAPGQLFTAAPIGLNSDKVVANPGDLLDQVFAGRLVPAVNGVGVVGDVVLSRS